MDKSSLIKQAVEAAGMLAKRRFRWDPDRDAKCGDAISLAWEMAQTAPDEATGLTIARYAVRKVLVGRQFRESARTVTGPNPRRMDKPVRSAIDLGEYFRPGDDPAEIVCFRLTFVPWLESLPHWKRLMAEALMTGDRTLDVGQQFSLSPGRVSQIRRELMESWEAFSA